MQRLLFDPQTSGGLLMAVDPAVAEDLTRGLRDGGYTAAVVGDVRAGDGLTVEA
jgi:selenide,water dikinase